MTAHTPGPWHVGKPDQVSTTGYPVIPIYSKTTGQVMSEKGPCVVWATHGTAEADAALIAAAPDMLAALKAIVACIPDHGTWDQLDPFKMAAIARAAIAKAEGKS
jgi:predicted aconitase with swiveling domain